MLLSIESEIATAAPRPDAAVAQQSSFVLVLEG